MICEHACMLAWLHGCLLASLNVNIVHVTPKPAIGVYNQPQALHGRCAHKHKLTRLQGGHESMRLHGPPPAATKAVLMRPCIFARTLS
eukprot:365080-Chlamydomonas_euryale.AAC.4